MQSKDVSQLPVFEDNSAVGSIYEDNVLKLALQGRDLRKVEVREVMDKPFPIVPANAPIDQVTQLISSGNPAIFVETGNQKFDIVTKFDIVHAVASLTDREARP